MGSEARRVGATQDVEQRLRMNPLNNVGSLVWLQDRGRPKGFGWRGIRQCGLLQEWTLHPVSEMGLNLKQYDKDSATNWSAGQ